MPKNLLKVHGKGLLLSILEKENILTSVKVFNSERFTITTKDWDSYWQPLLELNHKELEENLCALHFAWRDYINSRFDSLQMQDYCFRYFSLLDHLLLNCPTSRTTESWLGALRAVVGFECFSIIPSDSSSEALGAGICTTRNPCYLLSKLKFPNALDDSRFLPIVIVGSNKKPELFFHYRQYSLSMDSSMSLFLYPIVDIEKRGRSFQLLNKLADSIKHAADPWTTERGRQLFQGIIKPIVQFEYKRFTDNIPIEFIDIGAGSGSLVAALCQKIRKLGEQIGFRPKFRLRSVDLEPSNPARFFLHKNIQGQIDSFEYTGDDYRRWLSQASSLPEINGIRIALISKLLDTCSNFSFVDLNSVYLSNTSTDVFPALNLESVLPQNSLSSEGRGSEYLSVSNSGKYTVNERIYSLLSLSQFYKGMTLLSPEVYEDLMNSDFVLPSRKFNQECLVTSNHRSIIDCLTTICDYLIIIDMDLTPNELIDHITEFSLEHIVVCNVTKTLKLKGNFAYVLSLRSSENYPNLKGDYIW